MIKPPEVGLCKAKFCLWATTLPSGFQHDEDTPDVFLPENTWNKKLLHPLSMLLRHVLRTTEQQRNRSFQPQARHHTDCLLQKISWNNSRTGGAAAGWVPGILSAKEHSAVFVTRPMDAWHQMTVVQPRLCSFYQSLPPTSIRNILHFIQALNRTEDTWIQHG